MQDDPLGWLLPEASAAERAELRRVVTALRLLRDDARAPTGRAAPSWLRARAELERARGLRRRRALAALLGAYLQALRPAHSFLELGPRAPECSEAWRTLLVGEASRSGLLPQPAEPPDSVVRRLLEAARAGGAAPAWCELWEARRRHLASEPAEAERHWEDLFARARAAGAAPPHLARLLAGQVAARLERGQPERASTLHAAHAPLAAIDPTLRRLFGWSALLAGELVRARELLVRVAPARLPAALAELRTDVPALAPLLPGELEGPTDAAAGARLTREALGVRLLLVFVCGAEDERAESVALEAPAAARAELERALRAAPLCADPALPAGPCRARRLEPGEAPLAHALGGARTRALLRLGVRDDAGLLAGWIQLESEHLGLPCAARAAELAQGWRAELLARRLACAPARPRGAEPALEPFEPDDPRAEFVAALRARLAGLGAARARWLEPAPGGGLVQRWEHGAWRAEPLLEPAQLRSACERAQPLTRTASHGQAFALPLAAPRAAPGLLCCEFAPGARLAAGLEEARARLVELAPLWWATAFRAAWRACFGRVLAWDPGCRQLAGLEPALRGAEAAASLLIVGPPGAGRRTLARWRHFRTAPDAAARLRLADVRVHELAGLEAGAQRALARAEPGFCVLGEAPAHVLRESGRLERELEQALEPLPLFVAPLAERRDEIAGLVRAFAGAARFDDEALGALWRQDWPGQVSELAALVAQLSRAHAGAAEIGAAEVRAALRSRGLAFRARLASRSARARELGVERDVRLAVELALASTRHKNGAPNLARAARYLGWDPETLAARAIGLRRRVRRTTAAERKEAPAVSRAGASGSISPEGLR